MPKSPELLDNMLSLAMARAQRLGLPREECEDCAASFIEHLLQLPEDLIAATLSAPWADAWLTRSADNWACNALKRHHGTVRRQADLDDESIAGQSNPCATVATPAALVLRDELHSRLLAAAFALEPAQQDLFIRRFLLEESIEDIAIATGRSRDAIRQALTAVRRQVRKRLLAAGIDETEARQYVAELLKPLQPASRL